MAFTQDYFNYYDMDLFKKFYQYSISIISLGGYVRLLQYFLFQHYKFKVIKKNKELIERKKADVCYICALGPSLKSVDLAKIKGDTLVVNHFYKMKERNPDFVPTYYLMYDPGFATSHRSALNDAIDIYGGKGTTFLLNSQFSKLSLCNSSIYYISAFKGFFSGQNYSIDKPMPSFPNVVGVAIGTVMGMGYKKIVLLGCDFNSFASPVSNHCYEEKDNNRRIKLWYELYRYSIVAYGHEEISSYAKKNKIEIVNSTKGSLIDSYPFQIDESIYK